MTDDRIKRHAIRDAEIYEKRIRGASLAELAAEFDLTESRISLIVKEQRQGMPERSREGLIAASIDQLEYLREKVIELSNLKGAPVTVGQHGDILYDDGEIVRDYSLRLKAIAEAHKLNVTFAKRLGLDAPIETNVKASVQYEIVGVDPEELT